MRRRLYTLNFLFLSSLIFSYFNNTKAFSLLHLAQEAEEISKNNNSKNQDKLTKKNTQKHQIVQKKSKKIVRKKKTEDDPYELFLKKKNRKHSVIKTVWNFLGMSYIWHLLLPRMIARAKIVGNITAKNFLVTGTVFSEIGGAFYCYKNYALTKNKIAEIYSQTNFFLANLRFNKPADQQKENQNASDERNNKQQVLTQQTSVIVYDTKPITDGKRRIVENNMDNPGKKASLADILLGS